MATSAVPSAITGLVAVLEGALGAETVFDGPELTGAAPEVAVCVGFDGDPGGDMRAVENWTQVFVGLGRGTRDESFDVLGCVVVFTGDTAVAAKRSAAFATFAAVEAAVRAASLSTLGLAPPAQAEFRAGELYQEQTGQGLQVRIPWTVAYTHVRL